jgi:hypothetical protein
LHSANRVYLGVSYHSTTIISRTAWSLYLKRNVFCKAGTNYLDETQLALVYPPSIRPEFHSNATLPTLITKFPPCTAMSLLKFSTLLLEKSTSQRLTLSPTYVWHKEKRALPGIVQSRNIFCLLFPFYFFLSLSLAGFEGLIKLEVWRRIFDVAYRASEMTHELRRWGVTPWLLPRLPWLHRKHSDRSSCWLFRLVLGRQLMCGARAIVGPQTPSGKPATSCHNAQLLSYSALY